MSTATALEINLELSQVDATTADREKTTGLHGITAPRVADTTASQGLTSATTELATMNGAKANSNANSSQKSSSTLLGNSSQ